MAVSLLKFNDQSIYKLPEFSHSDTLTILSGLYSSIKKKQYNDNIVEIVIRIHVVQSNILSEVFLDRKKAIKKLRSGIKTESICILTFHFTYFINGYCPFIFKKNG